MMRVFSRNSGSKKPEAENSSPFKRQQSRRLRISDLSSSHNDDDYDLYKTGRQGQGVKQQRRASLSSAPQHQRLKQQGPSCMTPKRRSSLSNVSQLQVPITPDMQSARSSAATKLAARSPKKKTNYVFGSNGEGQRLDRAQRSPARMRRASLGYVSQEKSPQKYMVQTSPKNKFMSRGTAPSMQSPVRGPRQPRRASLSHVPQSQSAQTQQARASAASKLAAQSPKSKKGKITFPLKVVSPKSPKKIQRRASLTHVQSEERLDVPKLVSPHKTAGSKFDHGIQARAEKTSPNATKSPAARSSFVARCVDAFSKTTDPSHNDPRRGPTDGMPTPSPASRSQLRKTGSARRITAPSDSRVPHGISATPFSSPGKKSALNRVQDSPRSSGSRSSASRQISGKSTPRSMPAPPLSPGERPKSPRRRQTAPKSAGPRPNTTRRIPPHGMPTAPLSPGERSKASRGMQAAPQSAGPRYNAGRRVSAPSADGGHRGLPTAPPMTPVRNDRRTRDAQKEEGPARPESAKDHATSSKSESSPLTPANRQNRHGVTSSGKTPRRSNLQPVPSTKSSKTNAISLWEASPKLPKWPPENADKVNEVMKTPGVKLSPIEQRINREHIIGETEGLLLVSETEPSTEEFNANNSRLYEYARRCHWEKVAEELRLFPRDAKCVDEDDGTTALHLAVMSRSNPSVRDGVLGNLKPAPIELIEQLVIACPEAAITRCGSKKYTPLTYACLVLHQGYHMADSAEMVRILLNHAPQCAYCFTDDGFSALDVHILSFSRFQKANDGNHKNVFDGGNLSTAVLQALLTEKPDLAEARPYKNKFRGPIELLYRSNLEEFKYIRNGDGRLREFIDKSSHSTSDSDWWAWKWVALILKFAPRPADQTRTEGPFLALHAAASLVGCPLPVLSIAAHTYPQQLVEPDSKGTLGNLPLHEVCSWVCDKEIISGDPFSMRRKAMAIQCLLEEYPKAAKIKNKMGETPLQLAIESCTLWGGGLELLVEANAEALVVPRKLRDCSDDNEMLLSRPIYEDDNESVDESDWVDPLRAVEGMYPFMVAAVAAYVPADYLDAPSFVFSDRSPEQRKLDLETKDLESIRSIFGLLRAKPGALGMYKPAGREAGGACISLASDVSEYTEVTFEDSLALH